MEMHSRQSLNEIHGISVLPRRRPRWRSLMRLGIARVLAVLKAITKAIGAEFARRRAFIELNLGITRYEIKGLIRRPRGDFRADDGLVLTSDGACQRPALPPISSPDLSPEGRPVTEAAPVVTGSHLKDSSARVSM
jgi:hypothetical protein